MKSLIISFSLMLLTVVAGCSNNDPAPADESANAPASLQYLTLTQEEMTHFGVTFSGVMTKDVQYTITLPAKIIVDQSRTGTASSLIDGRIKEIFADYGDHVSKGARLATIESMHIGERIAEALRLRAESETAQKEYERLQTLRKTNATSEKNLQRAESESRSLTAQYQGARQQLSAMGFTDADIAAMFKNPDGFPPVLTIRAPISGIVAERNATQGGYVQTSDPLFTIVNNSMVTVEASAYPGDLKALHGKMQATFTTGAFPDTRFSGTLSKISPVLSDESSTLPVWCSIANPQGLLKPNLRGELQIETGESRTALSIPIEALIYDGNDTYVFLKTSESKLEYRQVEAGQQFGDFMEIKAGLSEEDRVASGGVFMLKSRFKLSQEQEEE